jgi:hypothetical protein
MGALDDYKGKVGKNAKAEWRPLNSGDFPFNLPVLAFDQTLSQTGWVYLGVDEAGIQALARGTLRTTTTATGFLGTMDKAKQLDAALWAAEFDGEGRGVPWSLVVEMPAVGGRRTESSLMAAREIHRFCSVYFFMEPVFVSIQAARRTLGGPQARNDKKLGHEALGRLMPETLARDWNEHTRDAAILALGHLHDLKEGQR